MTISVLVVHHFQCLRKHMMMVSRRRECVIQNYLPACTSSRTSMYGRDCISQATRRTSTITFRRVLDQVTLDLLSFDRSLYVESGYNFAVTTAVTKPRFGALLDDLNDSAVLSVMIT